MDVFKNNIVAGVGLAIAAAVLAPIVLPVAARVGRPLAKSLVRGGMLLYEKGRETLAVAGESVEDIMAEIRAEHSAAAAAPDGTAVTPPPATAEPVRPAGGNGAAAPAQPDGQGAAMS